MSDFSTVVFRDGVLRVLRLGCAFIGAIIVTGCHLSGAIRSDAVVLGAYSTEVSRVEAAIYAGALQASGVRVYVRDDFSTAHHLLGAIDAGTIAGFIDGTAHLARALSPGVVVGVGQDISGMNRIVSALLPEGITLGDVTDVSVKRTLYVAPGSGVSVLQQCHQLDGGTLGVTMQPGFPQEDMADIAEINRLIGCSFARMRNFSDASQLIRAVQHGNIQAALYSQVPGLSGLVGVGDPNNRVPIDNLVPIYRIGVFAKPQAHMLNRVAGELSTEDLAHMIYQVRNGADANALVRTWLYEHGF